MAVQRSYRRDLGFGKPLRQIDMRVAFGMPLRHFLSSLRLKRPVLVPAIRSLDRAWLRCCGHPSRPAWLGVGGLLETK